MNHLGATLQHSKPCDVDYSLLPASCFHEPVGPSLRPRSLQCFKVLQDAGGTKQLQRYFEQLCGLLVKCVDLLSAATQGKV